MPQLINAQNITLIRQEKKILDNVSLIIGNNDFVTIVGPNGAGKSMLVKCLMGFFKPDSGTITTKKNIKIGYIPQKFVPDITIPMTVKYFLKLNRSFHKDEFDRIINETQTQNLLNKSLHILSGGEMQRVLLARALLMHPDILLMDEPAQNLDMAGQIQFYKYLETIHAKDKIAILIISHDLHLVMSSTKQVICLYHHICCSGTPQTITEHPEFLRIFGKDMANVLGYYQHAHNHTHNC
jgi:zinc transport system ATP-binding protein